MQVQPCLTYLQGGRLKRMPDRAANRNSEKAIQRATRYERHFDFSGILARSGGRARRLGALDHWTGAGKEPALRICQRIFFQLCLRKGGLELPRNYRGARAEGRGRKEHKDLECYRARPVSLQDAWRQVDSGSRLDDAAISALNTINYYND